MTRCTFILLTKHRMARPDRLTSFVCFDTVSRTKGRRRQKSASDPVKKLWLNSDVAIFEHRYPTFTAILITADGALSP